MYITVLVEWEIYVHICSGAYANNVKCMYSSICGHIVTLLMAVSSHGIYILTLLSDIVISGMYMAFEGPIGDVIYMKVAW